MAQSDAESGNRHGTIEEVVVTGTAGGAEIRKFDASFAITTMSESDIAEYAPQSTADLLKLVPGVWSESSGGVSGANVFVRGFPGGGDAPFYTLQVNGAPIFPPPTLSFLENTTLFRVDETVERVEALRGGPNPVFSNGQPGLTTNFILREGGDETEGLVKYTTSDYDLNRFDGYLSGEIGDRLYYMLGGYLESSPGIRDAGFNARKGSQFTVNLTKEIDNGTFNLFHRRTDDHGQWYLPSPLNAPDVDAEYSQLGALNRQRSIEYGAGLVKTVDLADGRGWDGAMTGGSVVLAFADNWELKNRFGYTAGSADTLGLVPDGGAVRVGDLGENHRFDAMHEHNARGAVTGPLTGAVTGRAIGAAEYIQRWGAWEVHKDIDAFTNDLSLAYNFERGSATLGLYNADSSSEDLWALGNFLYEVVQHGGERVNGIECYSQAEDDAGMDKVVADCSWNYDIDAAGDASTTALYIASTFDIAPEVFTVDFGVRWEDHAVDYSVDEGRDGTVDLAIDYGESETSWTLAGNYAFGNMGLFARINSGSKMPNFDDFRDNRMAYAGGNDLIQEVDQYELGWKLAAESFSLYATAFRTEVDPVSYVALTGAGEAVIQTQESSGLEIDALWQPGTSFSLSLNATLQDTEIKSGPNDGNETQRQPSWQLRLSPRIEFGGANVTGILYGTLTAVGERWSEPENVNELDAYEKLDLGLILRVDERFIAQFSADNITDEDALTEGDPRNITAPNGRFIMPRTLEFSIGYEF